MAKVKLTKDQIAEIRKKVGDKIADKMGSDNWDQVRRSAPAVAMHNEDVYLGTVSAGILVFRGNGGIEYWTEKTGLACQRIRDLQSLGKRLFAHVGTPLLDSGLMEIDPLTGKSRNADQCSGG